MMSVCAIGDSHLAALKLGWESIKSDHPGIRLVFFGAPGMNLKDLAVSDGSLVPTTERLRRLLKRTSDGLDVIAPSHDRFLVCGMKFAVFMVQRLYEKYRSEAEPRDNRRPLSDECLLRAAQGFLRGSLSIEVVEKLRQVSRSPIGVIPVPFRADESGLGQASWNRDRNLVARTFAEAARKLGDELDFQPFFPPASMLSGPIQTKAEYSDNSVRLQRGNKAHDEEDILHMNPRYGAEMLGMILADPAFAGTSSARAPVR
jgi:hypothetical protein